MFKTGVLCTVYGAQVYFRYIINQKRKIYKTLFPPVFQNTTNIRDVYLCNTQSV